MIKLVVPLLFAGFCLGLTACQQNGLGDDEAADTILINASIHTMDATHPTASALAIKNGKYIYIGDDQGARSVANASTELIDLGGKMLMPGINDAHQHPVEGGTKELFECSFPFTSGPDEISKALRACVADQPDATWIRGGQFSSDFFVDHPMESPRLWLDNASGNKAVALVDDAYHNAWLNTRAMELLGVNGVEDLPEGVEMALDQEGKPDGFMIEAFGFLKDQLTWSEEQYRAAVAHAVKLANGFGITGLKATAIAESELAAFKSLAENEGLSAHVAGAIVTPYGHRTEALNVSEYIKLRDTYKAPNFNTNFVKIFMDGVPTAARTAAMLTPYTAAKEGEERTRGQLHITAELLNQDVVALDAAGFTIKIHTAGDRSVRVALDAIEQARVKNGKSGARHELAHAGYVDESDINRFASLNAIPDFSPYIWFPSPIMDSVLTAVGERGEFYWPTKTLLKSGASVAPGSDWPAAVPSMNPWPGIEALVTRADPFSNGTDTLWADEAVSLADALKVFTVNGAKALRIGTQSGSIEIGKSADFIVLNHNLFDIEPALISDTEVLMTFFAGSKVYEKSKAADLIVVNAKIYTLAEPEWAEAMAITNGRISYLGSVEGAEKLVGPVSQRLDLDGRMVMPGINDAHLHPVDGALKSLYRCNFPFTAGPLEVQSAVLECVRNSGDRQWIIGGQWDSDFFVNNDVASPRGLLDEVSDDKAVFLRADSGHDAWLNTKGLELAGINKQSHPPEGGTIVRDEKGEPNGLLLEKAKYAVEENLPANTEEQYANAARELMQIANAYGVTGMKDASAKEAGVKSLTTLANSGELTAHMATSLTVLKEDWTAAGFDTSRLLRVRDQYTNNNIDTRHVKIYMDGVPTSSRTAAMLMNYLPVSEQEPAHNGDVHFSLDKLSEMLVTLDALGFTVKIHTAGDRSVRMALDAIEITRKKNGRSGLRHELAHAGYIHPDDISRFRPLNAVADLSPYIWHPSPIIDSVLRAVGPRGERYWPMRDLIAANAPMLAGSDWPSAVSSMNPWIGIEAMVTRANPNDETEGELWPEQAISLAEALRVFTLGGAKALRLEQETGSLETGKLADFIVLNQNIFEQASSEIGSTEVEATFFEGKLVYSRDQVLFNTLFNIAP